MDQVVLLAELQALADNVPDFDTFSPTSRTHQEWLGKLHALIQQWNRFEAASFRTSTAGIGYSISRPMAVSGIMGILHRAIADLQATLPTAATDQSFGPGAVYDFFKALRDLLASAEQSIFIVDPYLDEQIFDTYLAGVASQVEVRLLTYKVNASFSPAVEKFAKQNKMAVEARCSDKIHDRVLFLDGRSCWVLGQSIKDAAKAKPTYLAPLDENTTVLKKTTYEQIWTVATPLAKVVITTIERRPKLGHGTES
jgi:hypothetical protein